jgi:hypothetical protein
MQMYPPWWWAGEAKNMQQLKYYNIIVILTNCVYLLVYNVVIES